jgi:hypothetical protein
MPDVITALACFVGWLIIATAFGYVVGKCIKFGDSDPADWDELEPRRRARDSQNGIGRVDRAS